MSLKFGLRIDLQGTTKGTEYKDWRIKYSHFHRENSTENRNKLWQLYSWRVEELDTNNFHVCPLWNYSRQPPPGLGKVCSGMQNSLPASDHQAGDYESWCTINELLCRDGKCVRKNFFDLQYASWMNVKTVIYVIKNFLNFWLRKNFYLGSITYWKANI